MEIFAKIAEERIREAMERGEFDDLPGKGKPLVLDDDPFVPDDMKMAVKICKNAGCVPPELDARREVNTLRELVRSLEPGSEERAERARELEFKLMRFNVASGRPFNLDAFPEYEERLADRLTGGAHQGRAGRRPTGK